MAIKDKDGNVYKLRGPNPVMETQDLWDYNKIKFINMRVDEETTIKDKRNPRKEFLERFGVLDIGEELDLKPNEEAESEFVSAQDFLAEINEPVVEEPEPIIEPEPIVEEPEPIIEPEPIVEEPEPDDRVFYANDKVRKFIKNNSVKFWCVPAIWAETKDELYGEVRKRKTYGKKFQFEGVIVNETDFVLQFWTARPISLDSVIYPRDKGKRWWRIDKSEDKTGGFMYSALMADVNPDFS